MFYNYYEDYEYDSCISKGICSIGPRTSSLQEILIMYLKLLAFYTIELQNLGGYNKDAQTVILNTISMLMTNMEYRNEQFRTALVSIKTLLMESKTTYIKYCKEQDIEPKYIKSNIKFDEDINITKLITEGEKEFAERTEHLSTDRKNIFEIISFIIKSLAIHINELKDYIENDELEKKGFNKILILLNFLNYPDTDINDILDEINDSSSINFIFEKRIKQLQVEKYGEPEEYEISLSTRPNKAILVSGSNIRDLEKVLEYTKDKNIDVYTHGEMLIAHSYPKFHEYENLVGHYGECSDNCLLDFANFPGAILITKHSTENIEYLYRGRLFTTDFFVPQGAIKIENDNFEELVQSAKNAKGFKTGKHKNTVTVGCSECIVDGIINNLFKNIDKYKHIIIIGPENKKLSNKIYFENILKNLPENVFVISFAYKKNHGNIKHLKGATDFSLITYIINKIKTNLSEKNIDISVFVSKCNKHTISDLIELNNMDIKNIFLSKCTPIMLNPTLIKTLSKHYNIIPTNHPFNDLRQITTDK